MPILETSENAMQKHDFGNGIVEDTIPVSTPEQLQSMNQDLDANYFFDL